MWPRDITACSTIAEAAGQTAADSEVLSQQPLNSNTAAHGGKAMGNPVPLLTQTISPFSLCSQAEDDECCWCHTSC